MSTINLLASLSFGSDTSYVRKQVEKGGKFFAEFVPQICAPEQLQAMNQKGAKRFVQAANFALTGDTKSFDAVTAYMISAIMLSKSETITFKDAHFACGLNSDDAKNIKGVSRARLGKFLGNAGTPGTITSKVSRSTGKGGFMTALGITSKGDKNSFSLTATAKNHPLIVAYALQLEKMTDGAFTLLQSEGKI
ncbi:hypothetical protein [Methylobacillus sp.]|uniref:hypothetical protein n=1 Tax=Methylobacillus sp. TaxID=56818 RepID=UPI0012BDAA96|nr:hypothetical protein [Methylobacillus sp.]MPS48528.1 hypothetical protein [Methylobacillus sp.]